MMKDIESIVITEPVVEVEKPKITDVVPDKYIVGWEKDILAGIEDGLDPNEVVTAAKLMTYLENMGLLDILILLDQKKQDS